MIWHSPPETSSQFFSVQFLSLIPALSFGSCSGVGRPGEVLVYETPRMSAPFLRVLHLYRGAELCHISSTNNAVVFVVMSLWLFTKNHSDSLHSSSLYADSFLVISLMMVVSNLIMVL